MSLISTLALLFILSPSALMPAGAASGWGIQSEVGAPYDSVALRSLDAFRSPAGGWQVVADTWTLWDSTALDSEPGTGVVVGTMGPTDPLVTRWEHGDLIVEFDYMVASGAQAAILFQGRYGVVLSDSWGKQRPNFNDAGGIAARLDSTAAGLREGHAPRANASRAPGLWQHALIEFRAPRFDESGRKAASAQFLDVILNGVTVQEAVSVTHPTQGAQWTDEVPRGPLVLTGEGVSFKNIRYQHIQTADPVVLSDVRFTLYEGEFSQLSDLDTAEPARTGDARGLVWDLFGMRADRIGVRWEGELHVPRSGDYDFAMGFNWIDNIPYEEDAVAGQGRFTIDGVSVIEHTGADSSASGRITLDEGAHSFMLTYFKNRSGWRPIVFFTVARPGTSEQFLNAPRSLPRPESIAPVMPLATGARPYILRSFSMYEGEKKVKTVSVGDPGDVHYSLDTADGSLLYAWRGEFLDVGSMWHARGERQISTPLGQQIRVSDRPLVSRLTDGRTNSDFRFGGYVLDSDGYPIFQYSLEQIEVQDKIVPGEEGLNRSIEFTGSGSLSVFAAEGADIRKIRPGVYDVDGRYFIEAPSSPDPVIRKNASGSLLLLPVEFEDARATVTYSIIF